MSFNCVKGNYKPAQGYLLCTTPLKSHELEFPSCYVQGKIEGKSAEMVVDSGCTRTLVHKKFVKNGSLTGEEMSVLTATGERLIVPLAKVEIESGQGKHVELVGVLDKLPVDCLLGRSSFGQTLTKENVLKQWELARARTAPSPPIPIIFFNFSILFLCAHPKNRLLRGGKVSQKFTLFTCLCM